MLITRKLIRLYKVNFAILLFLILFGIFHLTKPAFAYEENGAYRPFGVGYKHKTVSRKYSSKHTFGYILMCASDVSD